MTPPPSIQTCETRVTLHPSGPFARSHAYAAPCYAEALTALCPPRATSEPSDAPVGLVRYGGLCDVRTVLFDQPDMLVAKQGYLSTIPLFGMTAEMQETLARPLGFHICDYAFQGALEGLLDTGAIEIEHYNAGFRVVVLDGCALLIPNSYTQFVRWHSHHPDTTLDAMVPGLADSSAHTRLAAIEKVRHALDLLSRLDFMNTHPGRRVRFVTQNP